MKRFLAVFLVALGFLVFLNAVQANATPVDSGQWIVDSKAKFTIYKREEAAFSDGIQEQILRFARDDKSVVSE